MQRLLEIRKESLLHGQQSSVAIPLDPPAKITSDKEVLISLLYFQIPKTN